MELLFFSLTAVSSIGVLVISVLRYRLELKRSRNTAWETAVRLMTSDPDARVRANDFADLVTALRYLEEHPECLSEHPTLLAAIQHDQRMYLKKQ